MLLYALACAPESEDTAASVDEVTFLTDPGPYTIGHHQDEVTYTDPEGAERSLRTSVWYPSHETNGFAAQYLLSKSKVALEDIAPATDAAFPVVVYSHGHQGFAEASSFLAEHLASHGYVVLAPDHTGNTTFDGSERRTAIYLERPVDLTAVLDTFAAGTLVADLSWSGDALVIGHSFGGYTSFASAGVGYDVAAIQASCDASSGESVCSDWSPDWAARFTSGAADPRFLGQLSMAPGDAWLYGQNVKNVQVPTLLMTGEFDGERTADGATYQAALAPLGGYSVNIVGGAHNTFTDVAGSMNDGQTLDPEEGWRLVRAYTLAFAESTLGNSAYDDVLSGERVVGEAAEVQ